MIDADVQSLSIGVAEAQIGGAVAGDEAAKQRAIGRYHANPARTGGDDVAMCIDFHAVQAAAALACQLPCLWVDEDLALAGRAIIVDGKDHPTSTIGDVQ